MNGSITSDLAIENIPPYCETNLKEAVKYALILFIDDEMCFSDAISKAARVHNVRPNKSIEVIVRAVVPDEFIKGRKKHWAPRQENRSSRVVSMELKQKRNSAKSLTDFVGNKGRSKI